MKDIVIEQLSKLKEKYQQHRVSVMVGAGFSKNACSKYPSWNQLLYDMVIELYQDDINAAFLRYLSLNPLSKISLDVFSEKESERIISRIGPLKLVSEFIARKGFRESIEHYIEERIPYIDKINNQFCFSGKYDSKTLPIIPENLSAHKKLVKMRGWERIYTTNYDKLLEYAADINGTKYQTITNAKDLSVYSDNVTIIKLHGDLHDPISSKGNRIFRFDGNPHQQYIISAEDYRNYPKEHEAFTQLMRIYLLQGVFCLIGFSGDDPNFVTWIEWVRDIVERESGQRKKEDEDYKIYLIGLSDQLPGSDKLIFYENHSIFYIPILRNDVKVAIGTEASNNDIRDLFCHFFEYLEPEEIPQTNEDVDEDAPLMAPTDDNTLIEKKQNSKFKIENVQKVEETIERKEYLTLWSKVYEINIDSVTHARSITIDETIINRLRDIKVWNRFVNYSYRQKDYLDDIWYKKELSTPEAELAILALKDTGIPVCGNILSVLSQASIADESKVELTKLVDRAKSLYTSWTVDELEETNPYESIIRQLFNLNFKRAKQLLNNWFPTGSDLQKKALLLSFFGEEGASEILIDYRSAEPNPKEQFYATRLMNLFENSIHSKYSISKFENTNVQDYLEVLSNYVKRVKSDEEKIRKYGDGKNQKTIYIGGKPDKTREAVAVLNFLIEAPALISHKGFYNIIKADDWYPVHKTLFELFPFATLFYSIQCLDKKIRTRIGQDYAYSDHIASHMLDAILNNLLIAYLSVDTPAYLKESILTVSKEMFVSVPSKKWEALFMNVWNNVVLESRYDNADSRIYEYFDAFVNKGLNSIKSTKLRQKIVIDVLSNAKKNTSFSINCLYYLNISKRDGKENNNLSNAIDKFVSSIDIPEEITIAGNISKILTEKHKKTVEEKCVKILKKNIGKKMDGVVFHSAQYFVNDESKKRKVFWESVCESPLLWNNGISDEGHISSFVYLNVTRFIHRINIDKSSLNKIYTKLHDSFNEVLDYFDSHKSFPLFGDFDGLLSEMLSFLNHNEKRLATQSDYKETYEKVKTCLQKISGLNNTEDGLYSSYESEFRDALNFIFVNRDTIAHKDVVRYSDIVVNRLLMKNSDGLGTGVAFLRLFLENGLIGKDDETLMNGVVSVLDKYNKEIAQECNMELVMTTSNMARIGKTLEKYGYKSNGIKYWMRLHKSGRFVTNFD